MAKVRWTSRLGRHAVQRFKKEKVIWLTTVGREGSPQPRPVWFLWERGRFLIYSQAPGRKLIHIRRNPKVALSLNSDRDGDDVVVVLGKARIDRRMPPADRVPAYVRKYRSSIKSLGATPAEFAAGYSVPITITPTSFRGM
jgi:PPOX class probable F420-dependent enzyme